MKVLRVSALVLLLMMVAIATTALARPHPHGTPVANEDMQVMAEPLPVTFDCCCWNVDTYNCDNLDPSTDPNHAWWCGEYFASCETGDLVGGYGNDWDCKLDKLYTVQDTAVSTTVTVTALLNHDTEPAYDFLTLEYIEFGFGAQIVQSYDGKATDVPVSETFVYTPDMYTGPNADQIHIRWHFRSDSGWSDEDCGYPSSGAAQIDQIIVTYANGPNPIVVHTEDNEGTTNQWFDPECNHLPSIQGFKWNDEDCDGIWDPSELGLADWEIQLYQGPTLIRSTLTDTNGEYSFCNLEPGDYRVVEVQSPTMIQTYPATVRHNVTFDGVYSLLYRNFGNAVCQNTTTCTDELLGGRIDDFDTTDGPEPATVSAELDQILTNCQNGRLENFDVIRRDWCFGYTFSDSDSPCWQYAEDGCVTGASLEVRLQAGSGGSNTDNLSLREDGVTVWSIAMDDLQNWQTGGLDDEWNAGDRNTFVLDLANLPSIVTGYDNVLATLQDGDLDFVINDDTGVDYVKLTVEVCTEVDDGSIHGTKFHDLDFDGFQDAEEYGLHGWEIRLYDGPTLVARDTTDLDGDYSFTDLFPGQYRITEVVGDNYVQTWPHTVSHLVDLGATGGLYGLDFGNRTCDFNFSCVDSCIGGVPDNFSIADGPEPTTVGTALDSVITNCSLGPQYFFDEVTSNLCFGHTFYDTCSTCWETPVGVAGAKLPIRMKGASTATATDGLHFREAGETVWAVGLNTLYAPLGIDPQWDTGDTATFHLDLADLPPWRGITNILATLQDGDLDISVSDDTGVDYVKLVIEKCRIPQSGTGSETPAYPGLRAHIYPNPFNPVTRIDLEIPAPAWTNLTVYDLQGRRVITLMNEFMPANHKTVRWDGRDSRGRLQAAGVYFIRAQSGKFSLTKKAVLLK